MILSAPIKFGTRPAEPIGQSLAPPPYISVFFENGELRDCDPLPAYPGPKDGEDEDIYMVDEEEEGDLSGSAAGPQASAAPELPSVPTLPSTIPSEPSTALPTGLISSASTSSFFEAMPGSSAMSRSPTSGSLAGEQPHLGQEYRPSSETLSDILRGLDFATQPQESGHPWDMSVESRAQAGSDINNSAISDVDTEMDDIEQHPGAGEVYDDDEEGPRPASRRRTLAPEASVSPMTRAWRRTQRSGSVTSTARPPPPTSIIKRPDTEDPSATGQAGLGSASPG